MVKGTYVRMTAAFKKYLIKRKNKAHVDEFGDCVGRVLGPLDYGTSKGPEIDVMWLPDNLHYAYMPSHLRRVRAPKITCSHCGRMGTKDFQYVSGAARCMSYLSCYERYAKKKASRI